MRQTSFTGTMLHWNPVNLLTFLITILVSLFALAATSPPDDTCQFNCEGRWYHNGTGVVPICDAGAGCSVGGSCVNTHLDGSTHWSCRCTPNAGDPYVDEKACCQPQWTQDAAGYVDMLVNCFTMSCADTCDETAEPKHGQNSYYMCDCPDP
ncbi:MAG: hypothetical protein IPM29_09005 [Planctomycetes bacterium]|nr:hypothetical protein [Planctomycetota bacterium]